MDSTSDKNQSGRITLCALRLGEKIGLCLLVAPYLEKINLVLYGLL